jgi:hypothetical protein
LGAGWRKLGTNAESHRAKHVDNSDLTRQLQRERRAKKQLTIEISARPTMAGKDEA